jgi:hypothetical protein
MSFEKYISAQDAFILDAVNGSSLRILEAVHGGRLTIVINGRTAGPLL